MAKRVLIVVLFSFISLKANVTPTDVFIEAKSIKLAIASMVNGEVGVSLLPVIDIDLQSAKPSSVYAMGFALNEKIRLQMLLKGVSGWEPKEYPNEKIKPKNVKELMLIIQENLKRLDSSTTFIRDSASNKVPADVMQELVFANLWMDKFLATKAKPNYSYQVIRKIEYEVKNMMSDFDIEEIKTNFKKYPKVTPKDVFINAQNIYADLAIFNKLKGGDENPLRPYDVLSSGVKIQPIDVFTISSYILSYLYSLKYELGLKIDFNYSPPLEVGIKPNDVYLLYDDIHYKILQILAHLGGKK